MIAVLSTVLSIAFAALTAAAGYDDPWLVAGAVSAGVVALAIGWSELLGLPHRIGSIVLIVATGVAAALVAHGEAPRADDPARPLSAFAAVVAIALLAAFLHELLRRDGRPDVLESVTGTLTGQIVALLAAGWVLLVQVPEGPQAVVVGCAAVAVARIVVALPVPPQVAPWAAVVAAGLAGMIAAIVLKMATTTPAQALVVGAAAGGVGVALDRLFDTAGLFAGEIAPGPTARVPVGAGGGPRGGWDPGPHGREPHSLPRRPGRLAVLAVATAPFAAAGTVAYALMQFTPG